MRTMLLSINPEHVQNILSGTKQYEFRKVRCRSEVNKIIIYATSPIMQVVAEVGVVKIIEDNVDTVWNITKKAAGITRDFYDSYYQGREKAIAYELGDIKKYAQPKHLADFGVRCAPQSFVYVNA